MTIKLDSTDMAEDYKHSRKNSKHMVYSKMDKIITKMKQGKDGVPVKSQKSFLSTIPDAFTGVDLVAWLVKHLQIVDISEAHHLATLLCQFGYFFPITENKNPIVKDDNSLYRFQEPCYWPSYNLEPNNTEYAIFLAKRTLRNKQKHGLEDYEQTAFTKFEKMLCDKWEFIFNQAEEQVRLEPDEWNPFNNISYQLSKGWSKEIRLIRDSQEKAFWRIHRPPPGQPRYVDEGPKRNFSTCQITKKEKKTVERLNKKIKYLQDSIDRPRLRISKAFDGVHGNSTRRNKWSSGNFRLLAYSEQYNEYDPILSGCQPSNPWHTEETLFWELNSPIVDIPLENRVKMWGFEFQKLLEDSTGKKEFEDFLKKEYSHENIRFLRLCKELTHCPNSQINILKDRIYQEFLAPGAVCEINIDCKTMENVQENLSKSTKPNRYVFCPAYEHIYTLMKKDSYTRFLRSEHYKNLLSNGQQQLTRKKFFTFKKKIPSPSPQVRRRSSASSTASSEPEGQFPGTHSYSTGNLRELDDKSTKCRRSYSGSRTVDMKKSDTSPNLTRKFTKKNDSPRKNKLEVPNQASYNSKEGSNSEPSSPTPTALALCVPSKSNVVAPWED